MPQTEFPDGTGFHLTYLTRLDLARNRPGIWKPSSPRVALGIRCTSSKVKTCWADLWWSLMMLNIALGMDSWQDILWIPMISFDKWYLMISNVFFEPLLCYWMSSPEISFLPRFEKSRWRRSLVALQHGHRPQELAEDLWHGFWYAPGQQRSTTTLRLSIYRAEKVRRKEVWGRQFGEMPYRRYCIHR